MKRAGNLIQKIADPDNLRLAFWKARKGKQGKQEITEYRRNLDGNLLLLREQLLSGSVEVGHYHYFTIYDPKERIICAASFPERVLHHALMNVCHQSFEDFQIFDSYATRPGKGTYASLHRAEYFQKKYGWFLKLDIRKYFDNIDQQILLDLLARRFKDQKLLDILEQIIGSYAVIPGKGVPIGNLTSQYFANYYLTFADRLVKEKLGIIGYVRYMDDMVLWHNDKDSLKESGKRLEDFLESRLHLELKTWCLNKSQHGLNLVGYKIYQGTTLLNNRSKKRFQQKMKDYREKLETGIWTEQDYQRHILPLLAFTSHASTFSLRKNILETIKNQN